MNKLLMAAFVCGAMLISAPSFAAPGSHLDWGYQLNASEGACPPGNEILKVTRKIVNAVDSGTGQNIYGYAWWANTEYVQQISVVEMEPGHFCAKVKSQGSFVSVGGDGPGCATDTNDACGDRSGLAAGVTGTFQGGLINTFEGTFTPGAMRTKGSIGTLDGQCDASTAAGCPASVFSSWRNQYFSGATASSLPWWGWVYHAGNNGGWVNGSDGNEGNISGE